VPNNKDRLCISEVCCLGVIVLNKKNKILISASIFLNIVLISIIVMSVIQMNNITERTLKINAIDNLFELHEIISKQENVIWSDLDLLSKQLEDAGLGTMHALNIGVTSKTIDKADAEILLKLGNYLIRYSSISKSNLSAEYVEEMKSDLIRFNTILAENGFNNEDAFGGWTKQNYLKKVRNIVSEIEKIEGNV
jgi:hypothetical protein